MRVEGTILLVEDNPDDVALTLRAFKQSHLANEIVVVRDGLQAIDFLFGTGSYAGRDPADTPALILLDLQLPKVDGLKVLHRLRADPRTELVPVVILTSSRLEEDRLEGYRSGANSFLQKPVDFVRFAEAVQQLSVYWLILNQPPPHPLAVGAALR